MYSIQYSYLLYDGQGCARAVTEHAMKPGYIRARILAHGQYLLRHPKQNPLLLSTRMLLEQAETYGVRNATLTSPQTLLEH